MKRKTVLVYLAAGAAALLLIAALFNYFFSSSPLGRERSASLRSSSLYNAEKEIQEARENLKNSPEKAKLLTNINYAQGDIAITFDGLPDADTTKQILDLLKRYDAKATFFVEGMRAAEEPELVGEIVKAGQKVENYSLAGRISLEKISQEQLVKNLCSAQKIINMTSGRKPSFLKAAETAYTDNFRQVAEACGLSAIVKTDKVLNAYSFPSYDAAVGYVRRVQKGSIISFRLNSFRIDEAAAVKSGEQLPAKDKQPGLKVLNKENTKDKGQKKIIKTVEFFLRACKNEQVHTAFLDTAKNVVSINTTGKTLLAQFINFKDRIGELFGSKTAFAAPAKDDLESLRAKNNGKLAEEIKSIHTTERAINYSFAGVSDEAALDAVLNTLEELHGKATFFVTEKDLKRYPDAIKKIIKSGNEVGIGIVVNGEGNFYNEAAVILRCDELLMANYGITADIVKQLWGPLSKETLEAVSATGKHLVGQVYTITKKQHKDYTSPRAVIKEIFPKSVTSFGIGQQIFFRLDFYTDPLMCSNLLKELQKTMVDNIAYATESDNPGINLQNNSSYSIKSVGEIMLNKHYTYEYPVPMEKVPANLKSDYRSFEVNNNSLMKIINERYIGKGGSNDVNKSLGFSRQEIKRLDTAGVVHTNDNVIFLTFDDWGSDEAINGLLYVLKKHNAQATFFIRTNNISYNPNLLRAIACSGNEIGAHTDKHKPMVRYDDKTKKYISNLNREEYMQDLNNCYDKLISIVGDVQVDGRYALTRFFRPPTLVVDKMGLECVFESGYEYVIMGYSTKDYTAKSYLKIRYAIEKQLYKDDGSVRKGTIFVLHMGDASAKLTAEALDILLTKNEQKKDGAPGKFKVGRLSDYLRDGYDQGNPKKCLRLEEARKKVSGQ